MISNGIDITKISRFENVNDKFINKIFTKNEIDYINTHQNKFATMAGIYAAKEAFLKAIKKGIDSYALSDIEILHDEDNAPYIKLYNELANLKLRSISVSISHDGDYAISSCIVEL